jgi:hypothetical protein
VTLKQRSKLLKEPYQSLFERQQAAEALTNTFSHLPKYYGDLMERAVRGAFCAITGTETPSSNGQCIWVSKTMESWKPHTHDYGVKDVKNWKKPFD